MDSGVNTSTLIHAFRSPHEDVNMFIAPVMRTGDVNAHDGDSEIAVR